MSGSSYVKIPLRSSAILNIGNNDKYCFLWSKLASLQPCERIHSNGVSNNRQHFSELNIQSFDLSNGFDCSHVHIFEKLNNLSINMLKVYF